MKENELKEQWYSSKNINTNNYTSVLRVLFAMMLNHNRFLRDITPWRLTDLNSSMQNNL